jgi:hypothetical protein
MGHDDDNDDPPASGFTSKMFGDFAKRALMNGLGAVLTTEESLKNSLGDMKLPKEAMGYLVGQADRTKKEIIDVVARETRSFLSRLEIEKMLARVLSGTTIEISTRIRILPKEGGGVGVVVEESRTSLQPSEPVAVGIPESETSEAKPRKKRRKTD